MSNPAATQDSEELEALFDSIVAANIAESAVVSARVVEIKPQAASEPTKAAGASESEAVINQIGHMARNLHDALRELGLNKEIEKVAASIPDTQERLNYVATLTEKAADRVLNATEAAHPLVEKMEVDAQRLATEWQRLFDNKLNVEQFKQLATQTHAFLNEVPKQAKATNGYLMEIMMAQDFQDLTGQVIKKIIVITKDMEQQLLTLLVDHAPAAAKAELGTSLLNGPVINPGGRSDVVTSQDQVDELLASLGF
jgi:chemotaxis protein CheZ